MDKKLIIQIPYGKENEAIIAGASENNSRQQLISDVTQTAREYGDSITNIVSIQDDVIGKSKDGTVYETFNKRVIMEIEDENDFLFPNG